MSLPDSYTMKTGAITAYFDAILNAEAPERFSIKFLDGLGFSSSNDRLLIGILKDLGFLNADGKPTSRYYQFLDKGNAPFVLAEGIRDAYSSLFSVNKSANELDADGAYNKLRSLYRGEKKDTVIKHIAKTFVALCANANFSANKKMFTDEGLSEGPDEQDESDASYNISEDTSPPTTQIDAGNKPPTSFKSLQYHINIVLPDTRDQATYDAIFKSLRDHLG